MVGLALVALGGFLIWGGFKQGAQFRAQERKLKAEGRYMDAIGARAYGGGVGFIGFLGVLFLIAGFIAWSA